MAEPCKQCTCLVSLSCTQPHLLSQDPSSLQSDVLWVFSRVLFSSGLVWDALFSPVRDWTVTAVSSVELKHSSECSPNVLFVDAYFTFRLCEMIKRSIT